MANVLGKQVSDGSHSVIYKEAGAGEVAALSVEVVMDSENVRYKIATGSEVANALVSFSGSPSSFLTADTTLYTADSALITADQTEI